MWKNCTNCVLTCRNLLICRILPKSTLSRCRWKDDCNERWKKQCHENKHMINSSSIEVMNAAKWLKKRKNCVARSSNRRMKRIERLTSTQTIANKRLYTRQKFWNFAEWLMWISRKKMNYDVWSNKSKLKVTYLMNYWRCSFWSEMHKKM